MTSATPWSVKGIDPKAREVAKDLARRSGMTLGEWLNRMILEDDGPEEITSQSYFTDRAERTLERSYAEPARPEPIVRPASTAGRFEAPQHPGDEIARVAQALDRLSGRFDQVEGRPAPFVGVDGAMREAMARLEATERNNNAVAARFEGAVQEARSEQARLAERLRKIELEASGPRSAEALRSLETALGKVANHLYEGESRTRDTLAAMERRIEEIGASGWADPATLIEEVATRVDARLSDAETRTAEALVDLGRAFANLDARVETVENGGGSSALEEKLEALSATLNNRVEEVRGEIAEKLAAATQGRFDRMESKLGEMAESVRKAEHASGQAIEKIGREVLTMADSLNRRVQVAEQRSADAIGQVGGEVARIAQAMESRLGRVEGAHTEALERLSAEIGRITERLAERIGSSERRAAQAIDDVGEQVARVSERIQQRHERSSDELADRIRLSEERTARLLDEAREKIDRSLAESQRRLEEQAAAIAAPAVTPFDEDPFAEFGPAEPAADPLALQAFAAPSAAAAVSAVAALYAPEPTAPFPAESEPPAFDAADFEAADGFAPIVGGADAGPEVETPLAAEAEPVGEEPPLALEPIAEHQEDLSFAPDAEPATGFERDTETLEFETAAGAHSFSPSYDVDDASTEPAPIDLDATMHDDPAQTQDAAAAPVVDKNRFDDALADRDPEPVVEEPSRPLSTREVIEQARAAARAAAGPGDGSKSKFKIGRLAMPSKGAQAAVEEAAEKKTAKSLFSAFSRAPKKASGGPLNSALLVAGGAAFLGLGAAGIIVMDGQPGGSPPQRVAEALANVKANGGEIVGPEADTTPFARAAIAIAPVATSSLAAPAAPDPELDALYTTSIAAIQGGKTGGLDSLRKAANLGHSPSQFYLAKLYEKGEAGLAVDLSEARRWTERAAEGGNRHAMHNLAMAYIKGEGGPKNAVTASQWFRRAADLGLVDSQFNLGALYERGLGVSQNAAEAYKWYLVAARTGDEDAQQSAARVRGGLSPEARTIAESAAQSFRPALASAPTAPTISTATVVMAQRVLSRLAYYEGPVDGQPSPLLAKAVAEYQRNERMAATGALDQATISKLQVFTR